MLVLHMKLKLSLAVDLAVHRNQLCGIQNILC